MRKIRVEARSTTLSQKDLWKIVTTIENYPKWCKFCQRILVAPPELVEGTSWVDITTLLWIPLKAKHIVTKIKPFEEFHVFLPLSGGGKMWFQFDFKQKGEHSYMTSEVTFDLRYKLINATVGYILEKRWKQLMEHGFPGLDEKKYL